MSRRVAVVTALSVWLVGATLAGVAIGSAARAVAADGAVVGDLGFPIALLVNALGFVTVGAFLGARLPRHPIGWLLAGWGTVMVASAAATSYDLLVVTTTGTTVALSWVRWGWAVLWHPMFALLFFTLLLFPDGRLPSASWRHVARVAVAWYALLALAIAFSTDSVSILEAGPGPPSPIPTTPLADAVVGVLLPGQVLLVVVALAATLLVRWRPSTGRMRSQTSWFVYAVSYALVAGILTLAYVCVVLALQWLVPAEGSDVIVAGSTLVTVALFQPVRRRIQRVVDRGFNRSRYDAVTIAVSLAHRLRDEVELTAVVSALTDTASSAVEPTSIEVRLPGRHEEAGP